MVLALRAACVGLQRSPQAVDLKIRHSYPKPGSFPAITIIGFATKCYVLCTRMICQHPFYLSESKSTLILNAWESSISIGSVSQSGQDSRARWAWFIQAFEICRASMLQGFMGDTTLILKSVGIQVNRLTDIF